MYIMLCVSTLSSCVKEVSHEQSDADTQKAIGITSQITPKQSATGGVKNEATENSNTVNSAVDKMAEASQPANTADEAATGLLESKSSNSESELALTINEEDKIAGNLSQSSSIGRISASYNSKPFKQAIIDADLIVEAEILDKIKEMDEPMPKTLFKAKILKIYKDNDSSINKKEEIQLLQDGNSKWIFDYHIMPQIGDKSFLYYRKLLMSIIHTGLSPGKV